MRLGNDYDWTAAAVAMLRQLWLAGIPSQEIARRLHTTKCAVCHKRRRVGLPGRPSPIAKMVSAMADVPANETNNPLDRMRRRDKAVRPLLTRMWADGEGQGAIAQACGIGRDAVKRLAKLWELPERPAKPDRQPGGGSAGNVRPGRIAHGPATTMGPDDEAEGTGQRKVPSLAEVLAMSEQGGALAGLR